MALGAFVAGLLLAETEFRRAIETAIDPFKGLLLGVFFFTVGMSIDIAGSPRIPSRSSRPRLLVVNSGFSSGCCGCSISVAGTIETALLLGPAGEFAFIVLGLAVTRPHHRREASRLPLPRSRWP